MAKFKDRLNEALFIRKVSAAELSRLSGIDEGTLSNYKKGKYEPKQRKLEAISIALNVSIPWLMGADVPMERESNHNFQLSESSENDIKLTPHEISLVIAYRQNPEMQKSVDKLLGIEGSEKIHIIPKIARSGNTEPLRLTDSEIQKLTNLPDLSPEDN